MSFVAATALEGNRSWELVFEELAEVWSRLFLASKRGLFHARERPVLGNYGLLLRDCHVVDRRSLPRGKGRSLWFQDSGGMLKKTL